MRDITGLSQRSQRLARAGAPNPRACNRHAWSHRTWLDTMNEVERKRARARRLISELPDERREEALVLYWGRGLKAQCAVCKLEHIDNVLQHLEHVAAPARCPACCCAISEQAATADPSSPRGWCDECEIRRFVVGDLGLHPLTLSHLRGVSAASSDQRLALAFQAGGDVFQALGRPAPTGEADPGDALEAIREARRERAQQSPEGRG